MAGIIRKAAFFLIKGLFTLLFLMLKLVCRGLQLFLFLFLLTLKIVLAFVPAGE